MAASYPTAVWTPTVKTDKVDLVLADHVNRAQEEIVALQNAIGLNPKGNVADLVARITNIVNADGAFPQGTSFPGSPISGIPFWRTDSETLFVWGSTAAAWVSAVQLSNQLWAWIGSNKQKVYVGSSSTANTGDEMYMYLMSYGNTSYEEVANGKFTKISGIQTITVKALVWHQGATIHGDIQVSVGGQTGTGPIDSNAFTEVSFTIDVSSLVDGTTYDISVSLKSDSGSTGRQYCSRVQLIGS